VAFVFEASKKQEPQAEGLPRWPVEQCLSVVADPLVHLGVLDPQRLPQVEMLVGLDTRIVDFSFEEPETRIVIKGIDFFQLISNNNKPPDVNKCHTNGMICTLPELFLLASWQS
jgi:hypothetical protein